MWLRETGRGICACRVGSFPIAQDACVLSQLKWQSAYPLDYGIIRYLRHGFFWGGRTKFIHTLAPQAAPRVEPEFHLFLWISVRRDMPARLLTISGHRGPGALEPLRPSSRQAPFLRLKPVVGAAGPVAVVVGT